MPAPTTFLSRLIGLFLILVALCSMSHRQATMESLTALIHTPPLLLLMGMVLLATGLAIVLSHNVWSGGVLPVVVTVLGWMTLLRGVLLLSLPPDALAGLLGMIHFEQLFYLYTVITLVLGLYLTYGGFTPQRTLDRSTKGGVGL